GAARYDNIHGPGYRAVYNLADLENSRFVIATGQSGNPLSPLYGSFVERWRDGDYISLGENAMVPAHWLHLEPK
ncbi:MAG: penicillin acylase family protein, partial [Methyloceanibacter sp.]